MNTEKPEDLDESEYTTTRSGLKYAVIKEGEGEEATTGKKVFVHYTGWLTDGKRFDSSVMRNQPFSFVLGNRRVIPGWEEGVNGMKEGEIRQLIIPPGLAYGENGAGEVIPPNSTLIFEVKLLDVQ
ncbi:MAG: FKBP-type peptidyl-prolyl cis-trans isomerase [Calditrichia bacterium]